MKFSHFSNGPFPVVIFISGRCKSKQVRLDACHFTQGPSEESGICFNNKIPESDSVHVYENEFRYNGSGAAIGDCNNHGFADVFFTGSTVSSKLNLSKSAFQLEDATAKAGVETVQWFTTVSLVDVNAGGFMDN